MLEGILFDYDGTLSQTLERQYDWFRFWGEAQKKVFDDKKDYVLPDELTSFSKFKSEYNKTLNEKGVQAWYDKAGLVCDMSDFSHPVWNAYNEFKLQNSAKLYDGVIEMLDELKQITGLSSDFTRNRRVRFGINTTNSWKSIFKELESQDALKYFDSFITAEVLGKYHGNNDAKSIMKPSKISVALSLDCLGSNGDTTIHVGDTLSDLQASFDVFRNGVYKPENLITVGAGWGYDGLDTLAKGITVDDKHIDFDYIIESPKELVDIVKKHY